MKNRLVAIIILLTGLNQSAVSLEVPDKIFYNGKVVTLAADFPIVEAFAVKGERFVATGNSNDIRALASSRTQQVDLAGRTVIPGLVDNHMHLMRSLMLNGGLDFSKADSIEQVLEVIREAAAKLQPTETIFNSTQWNVSRLREKRLPNRRELDSAAPVNPTIVRSASRFQAVLNSAALRKLGWDAQTPNIKNGTIVKDPDTGQPTGELSNEAAVIAAEHLMPPVPYEELAAGIERLQQEFNALGLTGVREVELRPAEMRVYQRMREEGRLTLRVSMGLAAFPSDVDRMDEILSGWGVSTGFGDDMLRLDCVGELAAEGGGGGLMREPYLEPPNFFGNPPWITPEDLKKVMVTINRYGWRPCIHVHGDKMLDAVLDAFEEANQLRPIAGRRWVIEHADFLFHPDQIARVQKLGLLLSVQARPYQRGEEDIPRLGRERAEYNVPMRLWLDSKILVSGGTDWPSFPPNPFTVLGFYVSRATQKGGVAGPSQRISREEALRVLSLNNAYMTFQEKVKGSIETGKLADFLVLSDDYLTVPEDKIREIKPVATYLGGVQIAGQ
ncbi:MAG: amidohydrolase [Acidobacteria bacterium]|nr:amidohydrolase [Acidobacteriota bacterium]